MIMVAAVTCSLNVDECMYQAGAATALRRLQQS